MKRNKQKLVSLILAVVMAVSMISQIVPAAFAVTTVWDGSAADSFESGSGTKDDPYVIKTAEQLAYLAASVNDMNGFLEKHFRLDADILLNDTTNWKNWGSYTGEGHLIAPVNSWTPIGAGHTTAFRGIFDGDGHTVSGLYIRGDMEYAGLFGYIRGGTVSNVGMVKSYVYNSGNYTGGVAGYVYNNSIVSGCCNEGIVTGNGSTGGVAGYVYNNSIVSSCCNEGIVTGNGSTGGIAGKVDGTVSSCYNIGDVTGNGSTGGVAGKVDGTVSSCYNIGDVTGNGSTGGVVGYVYDGTVNDCYNSGTVNGSSQYSSYTGGVAGSVSNSTISGCYNEGNVTGCYVAGGVAGYAEDESIISDCYNTGTVTCNGENSSTGGVAGRVDDGTVNDCYNTGTVTGSYVTGGVVGNVRPISTVSNCYNIGMVTDNGKDVIGGVVGYANSTVNNCYYLSDCVMGGRIYGGIELTEMQMQQEDSFGGWNFNKIWEIGYATDYQYPTLRRFGSKEYYYGVCFFDGETCIGEEFLNSKTEFTLPSPEKEGLDFGYWRNEVTRYYVKDPFVPADDIDFQAVWTTRNTSGTVWDGSIDTEWEGNGTKDSPFLISSAEELAGLARRTNEGKIQSGMYFRQTEDIVLNDGGDLFCDDIAGKNDWTPIGESYSNSFRGSYDGGGHTVSGLYIRGDLEYAGLFGRVDGGTVSNVGMVKSYVYNSGNYTGGVAGYVYYGGTVSNCYNKGTVTGKYAGGVVGSVEWYGTVSGCYNEGTVTGSDATGGVAGYVYYDGTVSGCYNEGTVTGNGSTGGVAGKVDGTVSDCYNTGTVTGDLYAGGVVGSVERYGTVSDCYNEGTVTGSGNNSYTGGVVGSGSATDCYNTGNVTGGRFTGGVAGYGSATDCCNEGPVTGGSYAGGVVGYGSAADCRNIGPVIGWDVGGVVGSGSATDCYNEGTVTGHYAGGVAGSVYNAGTVSNCYNTGTVTGDLYTGGVAGSVENSSTISNCYNTGDVTGSGEDSYTGGVAGSVLQSSTVSNCYYLSGCAENGNEHGTALSDAQMRKKGSFKDWDFNKIWENGYDAGSPYPTLRSLGSKEYYYSVRFFDGETCIREELLKSEAEFTLPSPEKEGLDFGYWRNEETRYYVKDPFVPTDDIDFQAVWTTRNTSGTVWDGSVDTEWEGNGTKESPFLISSAGELAGLAQQTNKGRIQSGTYFRQTEDIVLNDGGDLFCDDIAGKNEWTPIGNDRYTFDGSYDGDGHTVSGLYIRGNMRYAGLFGRVDGETVSNVGIAESYVYNSGSYTGSVAGDVSYGIINNCYNTGTVIGSGDYNCTGGVAGSVYKGTVSGCYNTGAVTGNGYYNYTGGVAGYFDDGTVSNCRNEGTVTGDLYTGGVAGYADGDSTVSNCRNEGTVTGNGQYAYTGGVAGYVCESSTVSDCYNEGAVIGNGDTGGVVGDIFGTVISCYNNGSVTGNGQTSCAGGLAGDVNGIVSNCCNDGMVTGNGQYAYTGGVAGEVCNGVVSNCCNKGNVIGSVYTGGVVGYMMGYMVEYAKYDSIVSDCYNTGKVTGNGSTGGVVGYVHSYSTVSHCYNAGPVTGSSGSTGGVAGRVYGIVSNCYYLSGCVTNGNSLGTALTGEQMKTAEAFAGFDFDEYWEIGVAEGYDYPTLQDVEHFITYTVTFTGRDGEVLGRQSVQKGGSAAPPAAGSYSDGRYFYTFDHWEGAYTNVSADCTVTAVYRQTEIIKFNDIEVSFTVENGFSEEQLRVRLESYFSRKLCTTTNGYKMMCEVVWNEEDLLSYDPDRAGEYIIGGTLKITDPAYSQFADYYDMAEGSSVRVSVTVLPEDGQVVEFERDDLRYEVSQDGKSAAITGYTGAAAEIILPEKIGAYTVTAIADGAFAGNKTLTVITIPATVKTVGNNAFDGCSSLALVMFENGVATIGEKAFYDTDLVSVTLPDSVTAIGDKAFGYYGEDRKIEGYAIYCMPETAAERYAAANGIDCRLIGEQSDGETGVSAIVERDVTLVVAQVEQGVFYESAQQIVQENDNVSLFEIKIVDDQSREVQPGSLLTVSIPVPDGFDGDTCEVFRINADGTYQAMHAKLIDGKLVFTTPHLSYYAIVEGGAHQHTPGEPVREKEVAASCEAAGSYDEVICCSECGEEISREQKTITALGHDLIHHDAKAATCTETGWNAYDTCSRCDYTTYVEIPAKGHDWGQPVYTWSADNSKVTATAVCRNDPSHITTETADAASDISLRPTCTESGRTTYTATFEDPMFKAQTKTLNNVSPLGHKYEDVITSPTCTEGGYTTHTCKNCGDSFTDSETAPLGHNFGSWTETTPATCTEKGEETRACSRCPVTERRDTDALGHDLIHHDAKAAACTAIGWNAYDTCSRCDYTTYVEIPANGHMWAADYTVDKAATVTEEGRKSIHCTVCNAVKPDSEVTIEKIVAPAVDPSKLFSDVSKKAWYYGAVSYAVNNGLFAGSNGKFDPDGDMTRGMFVSVLARMAGVKVNNNVTTKFTDVKKGQWYAGAVKWASDNGIVTGSGGRFMPNDPITREQICTILVTYSKYMKITLTPTTKAVTFKDAKKISKWAKSAVATCQKAGLIAGSNGSFDPQGKATRAAVAQILMQFDKNFG